MVGAAPSTVDDTIWASYREDVAILVVEDEPVLARTLVRVLGERFDVILERSAEGARRRSKEATIELILMDRHLPDGDGVEVCGQLRASGVSLPIIILTGSNELSHQLAAYRAGADEYVTKPADTDLLCAKIAAHLRPRQPAGVRRVGPIAIDLRLRRAAVDGNSIRLSPTECRILMALAEHVDQLLPSDHLAALVWGPNWKLERNSLYAYVSKMRAKLGPAAAAHVITEPGRGWMLRSMVRRGR
jgi:DNA-binding response OmpR family regulator